MSVTARRASASSALLAIRRADATTTSRSGTSRAGFRSNRRARAARHRRRRRHRRRLHAALPAQRRRRRCACLARWRRHPSPSAAARGDATAFSSRRGAIGRSSQSTPSTRHPCALRRASSHLCRQTPRRVRISGQGRRCRTRPRHSLSPSANLRLPRHHAQVARARRPTPRRARHTSKRRRPTRARACAGIAWLAKRRRLEGPRAKRG
mmetsp:Transcript_5536/g.14385  ORF Transcript_5536/g.14385 Transcript_5536/m.14385 type:complete len:209 (+) Transcript_5536:269-895(+)